MKNLSNTLTICILIIIQSLTVAQSSEKWHNLTEKKSKIDTVTHLIINFSDEKTHFENINKYYNVTHLWLQEMQNENISKIKKFCKIEQLTISDSPDLNIELLFDRNIDCGNLLVLILEDNQISNFPDLNNPMKKVKKIVLHGNSELNINSFFQFCKMFPALESIDISDNNLTSIPDDIPVMNNIKSLNLSGNMIESLGTILEKFPGADTLNIENNLFNNPISEIIKLKNSRLNFVSIDSSVVYYPEWTNTKNLFPTTIFKLVSDTNNLYLKSPNVGDSISVLLPDSIELSLTDNIENSERSDSVEYGTFKLEQKSFQIFSDAYLHYPRLFPDVNVSYDSLLFEDRFNNLNYINNVRKNNPFLSGYIMLNKKSIKYNRALKKAITFSIIAYQGYINKYYRELAVYGNTIWVCKNKEFTKSYFRKNFIGTYKHPKLWNDIKIEYNPNNNSHTLILKSDTTFFNFSCDIVKKQIQFLNKKNYPAQGSNFADLKQNLKKFKQYEKNRTKREKDVNTNILKNKAVYEKLFETQYSNRWIAFKNMYMSEEEKNMTKQEWLEYYEKVIADEKGAIRNKSASIDATERMLKIDGYKANYSANLVTDTLPIEQTDVIFQDKDSNILAVKKILMILPESNSYIKNTGTSNSDAITMILPLNQKIMFVIETISGKVGVANADDISKTINSKNKAPITNDSMNLKNKSSVTGNYIFKMQMLDSRIGTAGQVYNILSW